MVEYAYEYVDENRPEAAIEIDPGYELVCGHLQKGRWIEAANAIDDLELRFGGIPQLQDLRLQLDLHLSAEETWHPRRTAPAVLALAIKALVLVNLILLPFAGALYLWGWRTGQL